MVAHGVAVPEKLESVVVIGHEHPAVGLREKGRVEKFKCFLKGKYKRKTLIVQPSFNLVVEGTDVLKEQLLSPILQEVNILKYECWVVDEKGDILYFGRLKDL